jgi:hypothetical protein
MWTPSYPDKAQAAAIAVLREAGFVPDGRAWWRLRFAKPGTKRKATVGGDQVAFYDVPVPGKIRSLARVPTTAESRRRRAADRQASTPQYHGKC